MVERQVKPSLRADRDIIVKIILRAINSAMDKLKSLVIRTALLVVVTIKVS